MTSKTLFYMWPFKWNFLILTDQLSLDQMSSQQKSRRQFLPESIMYLIDSHAFSVSCKSELFSFKTGSKTNNNQGNNGTNHQESWFSSLPFEMLLHWWNAITIECLRAGHGHVPLKVPNIALDFDVCVDSIQFPNTYIKKLTSNKLGRFLKRDLS